jgi:hypothetical protein
MAHEEVSRELIVNPTIEVGAGFKLRTRNRGSKQSILTMKEQPELCRLLIALVSDGWSSERFEDIPANVLGQLLEMGIVVPKDEIPDEVHFHCSLDQPPLELIPTKHRRLRPTSTDTSEFVVNPGVHVQIGAEPPEDLAERVPFCDQFQQSAPIVWVEDPATKVLAPYWLRPRFIEMIQRLVEGRTSPADLPPEVSERLTYVGVLLPKDHDEFQIKERQKSCAQSLTQLKAEQYTVVRNIIRPLQLAALRSYFRLLDQKGYLVKEPSRGSQSINRYIWHNEGIARFVHHQITKLVNQVVPEPVKPSYTYLSTYKSGAILPRHTDREQCAWNLSLLIDTNPEMELSDSWPIYLEVEKEVKAVQLEMGDGVLYRGTEIPHWRDALADGHTVTLIFCHFVPVDFKESLY